MQIWGKSLRFITIAVALQARLDNNRKHLLQIAAISEEGFVIMKNLPHLQLVLASIQA